MRLLVKGGQKWRFHKVKSLLFNPDFTSVSFETEDDYPYNLYISDDPLLIDRVLRYPAAGELFIVRVNSSHQFEVLGQEDPAPSEPTEGEGNESTDDDTNRVSVWLTNGD